MCVAFSVWTPFWGSSMCLLPCNLPSFLYSIPCRDRDRYLVGHCGHFFLYIWPSHVCGGILGQPLNFSMTSSFCLSPSPLIPFPSTPSHPSTCLPSLTSQMPAFPSLLTRLLLLLLPATTPALLLPALPPHCLPCLHHRLPSPFPPTRFLSCTSPAPRPFYHTYSSYYQLLHIPSQWTLRPWWLFSQTWAGTGFFFLSQQCSSALGDFPSSCSFCLLLAKTILSKTFYHLSAAQEKQTVADRQHIRFCFLPM